MRARQLQAPPQALTLLDGLAPQLQSPFRALGKPVIEAHRTVGVRAILGAFAGLPQKRPAEFIRAPLLHRDVFSRATGKGFLQKAKAELGPAALENRQLPWNRLQVASNGIGPF